MMLLLSLSIDVIVVVVVVVVPAAVSFSRFLLSFIAFRNRYGVVAVRGAEVYELADEEGHLLNDPATQKERVSPRWQYTSLYIWFNLYILNTPLATRRAVTGPTASRRLF